MKTAIPTPTPAAAITSPVSTYTPELIRIQDDLRSGRVGYWGGFVRALRDQVIPVSLGFAAFGALVWLTSAAASKIRRNPPKSKPPKGSKAVQMVRDGFAANPYAMTAGIALGAMVPALVWYNKHVYLPSLPEGFEKTSNEVITWGMLGVTLPVSIMFGVNGLGLGYAQAVGLTIALDGTLAVNKSPASIAAAAAMTAITGLELGYAMAVGAAPTKKAPSLLYRTFVGQH